MKFSRPTIDCDTSFILGVLMSIAFVIGFIPAEPELKPIAFSIGAICMGVQVAAKKKGE